MCGLGQGGSLTDATLYQGIARLEHNLRWALQNTQGKGAGVTLCLITEGIWQQGKSISQTLPEGIWPRLCVVSTSSGSIVTIWAAEWCQYSL